jgi:hypothetical protein
MQAVWQLPALMQREALSAWRAGGYAVECGDCLHFVRRELPRDNSHLFKDIILTHALRESDELFLDVVGLLPLQRGRS